MPPAHPAPSPDPFRNRARLTGAGDAGLHPGLRVELVPVPRAFSLSQREADVAILVGRPERGRAVATKLTDYSLGLYASHRYLAAAGTPGSAADLKGHRLVGNVEDLVAAPGLDYVTEFFGETRPAIAISTAFGQLEAVRGGAGIGVLHDFIVGDDPALVRVLPAMSVTRSYWLAYHESQRALRRVQAVVEFVRAQTAEAGGWLRRD
ncbi:LysR substrate-binding domain-containing protein [Mangrovicoccus ximenensis]|uniref:LysR substrate-binding domain-containing protein n=1 Tax=Mangrovicoccus ximenensis TaxID=1911570 RepID=UPI000D3A59EB|nr:LysR substrate-binding domain-containing protein [Mangrovicoccus ximenensis]